MPGRSSALIDTRVIYCGDNLDQVRKSPAACVDSIYIDPPFTSNRNYEVFWGIDAVEAVMMREDRKLGYFVGFDFTGDALFEIDRFRLKKAVRLKR